MTPSHDIHPTLGRIEQLYQRFGDMAYDGQRRESVSALEHALQCAQLAEWAGAEPSLVAAAFLHDIGHFVEGLEADEAVDDLHETRALPLLSGVFDAAVTEPIRLHVAAKRYLVATDPAYLAGLSAASVHSLGLQGGPMTEAERNAFESLPFAPQAVLLRRWDDAAKEPGKVTPTLAYYMSVLGELQRQPFEDSKLGIGPVTVV